MTRLFLFVFTFSTLTLAAEPGSWPIERLQSEIPEYRVEDPELPIQSIIYEGEPIEGKTTEVFAFYASPRTLGLAEEGERFPGIVLIHGGGGTAFSDWVWMWAQRGYAAIAMDLAGSRPPAPTYDANGEKVQDFNHNRNQRTRLEKGGLDHGRVEKFDSIGGTIDDDWPYHAVANVMKAHSLLRSLEGVDPDRTAVTGISWGGYTTCLVASLDNRFKAAVPVYGCGFLHEGESVQKPSIDALGDRRKAWVNAYDPGSHLAKCEVPIFWVNGTNDKHYVLDSYAKSYALVNGPKTFRIEPMMRHSHGAGWEPVEIGLFVDSLLKDGVPLATVGELEYHKDGRLSVSVESELPIAQAELFYTTDDGLRAHRQWESIAATVTAGRVAASELPEDANTWLFTITDQRGAMVTSEVGFRQTASEWKSCFNGKDLTGWHTQSERGQHGTGGNWGVTSEGILFGEQDPPGSGNGGLLLTDETFSEFELEITIRPDWGPDSGIFVRTDERGQGWQVYVDHHNNGNVGHLRLETKPYSVAFRPFMFSRKDPNDPTLTMAPDSRPENLEEGVYETSCSPEEFLGAWKTEDWNHVKIRVTGGRLPVIETWVNGLKVCRFDATKTKHAKFDPEKAKSVTKPEGSIGLQVHGGNAWKAGKRVFWKDIRIRRL